MGRVGVTTVTRNHIEIDLTQNTTRDLPDGPGGRYYHTCAHVASFGTNGGFFISGGYGNGPPALSNAWIFDLNTESWAQLPFNVPQAAAAAAVRDDSGSHVFQYGGSHINVVDTVFVMTFGATLSGASGVSATNAGSVPASGFYQHNQVRVNPAGNGDSRFVVFGGFTVGTNYAVPQMYRVTMSTAGPSTWTATWAVIGSQQYDRVQAAHAFIPVTNKIWFGYGETKPVATVSTVYDDMRSFDVTTSTWVNETGLLSVPAPSPRAMHQQVVAVTVRGVDSLFFHGGIGPSPYPLYRNSWLLATTPPSTTPPQWYQRGGPTPGTTTGCAPPPISNQEWCFCNGTLCSGVCQPIGLGQCQPALTACTQVTHPFGLSQKIEVFNGTGANTFFNYTGYTLTNCGGAVTYRLERCGTCLKRTASGIGGITLPCPPEPTPCITTTTGAATTGAATTGAATTGAATTTGNTTGASTTGAIASSAPHTATSVAGVVSLFAIFSAITPSS